MGGIRDRHQEFGDDALMAAYAKGEGAAFEELFQRYQGKVFNFLLRASGDRALAEDLFQMTFLRLHEARKGYTAGSFKGFLFAIATNLLRDEWRRAEHKRRVELGDEQFVAAERNVSREDMSVADPESVVTAAQTRSAVDADIADLPEGLRKVLLLSRYQALSNAEIAEALGISTAAVKVRLFRALRRIRAHLAADQSSPGEARHG